MFDFETLIISNILFWWEVASAEWHIRNFTLWIYLYTYIRTFYFLRILKILRTPNPYFLGYNNAIYISAS